jgi:hypothetical protein
VQRRAPGFGVLVESGREAQRIGEIQPERVDPQHRVVRPPLRRPESRGQGPHRQAVRALRPEHPDQRHDDGVGVHCRRVPGLLRRFRWRAPAAWLVF